jgi:hypothetical protein
VKLLDVNFCRWRFAEEYTDFPDTLSADVGRARECLKELMGKVRLIPTAGGGMEAELRHNTEGLMKLALSGSFKAGMVAGAGFEPTTFRL